MSDAAAATTMLADLDEVLRELLDRGLLASGLSGVTITFDAPARDLVARWTLPALDVFLYDVREASDVRDRSWHPAISDDGSAMLARAPLRLACTYAITAWAQGARDEHVLLSHALAILAARPLLGPELLPASLLVGDPPQPLATQLARPREDDRAQLWNAIGAQFKVSLDFTVAAPCDPRLTVKRGPPIATAVLSGSTRPDARAHDARFAAGGEVRGADDRAVAGADVSLPDLGLGCVSDERGRFVLPSVPAGEHTIHARSGAEVTSSQLTVPGDGVILRLTAQADASARKGSGGFPKFRPFGR